MMPGLGCYFRRISGCSVCGVKIDRLFAHRKAIYIYMRERHL